MHAAATTDKLLHDPMLIAMERNARIRAVLSQVAPEDEWLGDLQCGEQSILPSALK